MNAHVDIEKFFEIEEHPIFVKGVEVPRKKALVVDDSLVNIVSTGYKVVQPRDVYESFSKVTGLTLDKVVTNPHTGALLLGSHIADSTGYKHDLVFYTGHNGKHRTLLTLQTLRLACMNQCPTLLGNTSQHLLSVKHLQFLDFNYLSKLIEEVPMMVSSFEARMEELSDLKISMADFVEMYLAENKVKEERRSKVAQEITNIYHGAQGQESLGTNTAIKAFNAITYLNTHKVRRTKTELETRYIKNMNDSFKWFDLLRDAA
jgi:hypothetical protein